MKRFRTFLLTTVVFLGVFGVPLPGPSASVIKVGVHDFRPLIFTDQNGRASGIFADILKDFSAARDLKIIFIHGTWDQCLKRLETGEIDLLPAIARPGGRDPVFSFSAETVLAAWGRGYNRQGLSPESMPDLNSTIAGPLVFATLKHRHGDLLAGLDAHLADLKQDNASVYYQSMGRWISRPPDPPGQTSWLVMVLGSGLVFALFFSLLLRSRMKKKEDRFVQRALALEKKDEERKQAQASLRSIQWLLTRSAPLAAHQPQPYGDLTELNREGLILTHVGADMLEEIVAGFLELLDTSSAVYEKNGDYACGILTSGWCRLLDNASRSNCNARDNQAALQSGNWLCHESCWTDASQASIRTGQPADIECNGGLRIYAIPVLANGEVIGAINFGYGDPPREPNRIAEIADKYRVDPKALRTEAGQYESRPPFIVDVAKKRLGGAARLVGALVESRMAQSELFRERERLNVTLQSIGDGVITTDNDCRVILINRMGEFMTGYAREKAQGRPLAQVFRVTEQASEIACSPDTDGSRFSSEPLDPVANPVENAVLTAKDGTLRQVAFSSSPIVSPDGHAMGTVLVFRDVTEKREMESALRHAHKMEAIGKLAGGIAHEFNNVLGIVLGNTELSIEDLDSGHPVVENLREIHLASLRARDIVKQLLSFSRKIDIRQEPADLRPIVRDTLKLLRASIPSFIRIKERLAKDLDMVVADDTQIHQLLLNLCNNAAQAMENDGGELIIELKNSRLNSGEIPGQPELRTVPCVRLRVKDTGHGIPEKIRDRIFDPYFTTKPVGKGSGMGLAVVHGIVTAHGGAIHVHSDPDRGTAFDVYFPAVNEPAAARPDRPGPGPVPGGTEQILFVDDEPAIVASGARLLKRMGYRIVSETDPVRALERFRSDPSRFDLVISDMTMPGLTGDRLAMELLKIRQDIPIIICTGYSERISQETAEKMNIKGLLSKPVEKQTLAIAIRKALAP